MKRIFLKKDFVVKLTLLSFVFLIILPTTLFILWLLMAISFIFLFRKDKVTYKNSLSNAVDIVLAPVSGKISKITEVDGQQIVRVVTPPWGPYGLYLPFSSEVIGSQFIEGKKIWRGSKILKLQGDTERFSIEFQNKLGHKASIETYTCLVGGSADIWLRAGDKGRSSACFGYVPFGGSLVIKVPKDSELLVKENEKIKAGSTILAGIKG